MGAATAPKASHGRRQGPKNGSESILRPLISSASSSLGNVPSHLRGPFNREGKRSACLVAWSWRSVSRVRPCGLRLHHSVNCPPGPQHMASQNLARTPGVALLQFSKQIRMLANRFFPAALDLERPPCEPALVSVQEPLAGVLEHDLARCFRLLNRRSSDPTSALPD